MTPYGRPVTLAVVGSCFFAQSSGGGGGIQDDERLLVSEGAWHRAHRKHVDFVAACAYTHEPDLNYGCQYSKGSSSEWVYDAGRLQDKQALLALYYATGGSTGSWRANDNWAEDTDPCWDSWYGVTCNEHGRVIYLELPDNGLKGSIPTSLGDLTSLIKLDLSTTANDFHSHENEYKNVLTGALPSLVSCSRIEEIEVSGNQLTSLPADLYLNAPTLRTLSANHNKLTALPKYLLRFTKLHTLELAHNSISDTFPSSYIGKMKSIRYMHLQYNKLRGSINEGILGITKILVLDLSHNPDLTGELPKASIVQWPDSKYLSILNTSITGYISSLCIDMPFCWRFMFDTHKDLTWATADDIPDIVVATLELALANA